ncbi:MAG: Mrp/NBP35 family ATP-binding protein [bacterium]
MSKKKEEECKPGQACETCGETGQCSEKEKQEHEEKRLKESLDRIRHRIVVMSGKGGVGKSTVAANLAAALAAEGYQVGVLDADIHGPNIPRMLGVDLHPLLGTERGLRPVEAMTNLKVISMALISKDSDAPIVWRGPIKHTVIKQFLADVDWGPLDYLVVDLPPGTGDEPLSVAHILEKVDGSVIVTTPQDVALLDSRKAVGFSRLVQIPPLGIVENMSGMVCPHCGKAIDLFKVGGGEQAARELGVPFLGRIPIDPEVVLLCDAGKPIVWNLPESAAAKAFQDLARTISDQMETESIGAKRVKEGGSKR